MRKGVKRILTALIGVLVGAAVASLILSARPVELLLLRASPAVEPAAFSGTILLFGIIFFIAAPQIQRFWSSMSQRIERQLGQKQMLDVVFGAIGLVFGLIIAYFLSAIFSNINKAVYSAVSVILYLFCGAFCAKTAARRWSEIPFLTQYKRDDRSFAERKQSVISEKSARGHHEGDCGPSVKVLDSSVLIDGRVLDICKAGFLEGRLFIPSFILEELQKIADSSDAVRRRRGRRGLDIAAALGALDGADVVSGGYEDPSQDETDMKLLKLAQRLEAGIVTNDYNLNKVAVLSGVRVLNINELSNAVKPAMIPGDELNVMILKEGKEANQGVAYLDDGTMIVVEGARAMINHRVGVSVTSVLQTSAGRMIFAKVKESADA